jgi:hypothetical protein
LGAQSCLWISLRTSISKKLHLGPQNGPGSENLLKIVNCQNGQKTVLSHLEKVGGPRYPPRSPYTMLKRLGQVTYQLALPIHSKLHHVFHVSCLKKVIGGKFQIQTNLPELAEEGSILLQPEVVLDQREHRLRQRTIKKVLVQWKDTTPADATWEPANILQKIPHLKP